MESALQFAFGRTGPGGGQFDDLGHAVQRGTPPCDVAAAVGLPGRDGPVPYGQSGQFGAGPGAERGVGRRDLLG